MRPVLMDENPFVIIQIITVAANMIAFFNNTYILTAALCQLTRHNGTGKPAANNNTIVHGYTSLYIDTVIIIITQLARKRIHLSAKNIHSREFIILERKNI